jgi:uncharacterized repeat protein (TIGR01451 family)
MGVSAYGLIALLVRQTNNREWICSHHLCRVNSLHRYACTNNNCYGEKDRSVIWVTPVEDADIYIDYDNDGLGLAVFPRKALTSSKFVDIDQDMSGALIFATKSGTGIGGPPVDIAAAWGQDPAVSRLLQSISLDLGTVVRPFPNVRASKLVDKAVVKPGEILTYTIKLLNSGQTDLPGKSLTVFDTLDAKVSYIAGSMSIAYNVGTKVVTAPVADSVSGTPFPLDDAGYVITTTLPKRGGAIDIIFNVKLDKSITGNEVLNSGTVKQPFGSPLTFTASSTILFEPLIAVDNKVYVGADEGASCGTAAALELARDIIGSDVTYCFNVTNIGNTHLTRITLDDRKLLYTNTSLGLLAPGVSTMVSFKSNISQALLNIVNITATPVYSTGLVIAGLSNVSASDPSEVGIVIATPSISIVNKVFLGVDGAACSE